MPVVSAPASQDGLEAFLFGRKITGPLPSFADTDTLIAALKSVGGVSAAIKSVTKEPPMIEARMSLHLYLKLSELTRYGAVVKAVERT
jgi:hypothetical protein